MCWSVPVRNINYSTVLSCDAATRVQYFLLLVHPCVHQDALAVALLLWHVDTAVDICFVLKPLVEVLRNRRGAIDEGLIHHPETRARRSVVVLIVGVVVGASAPARASTGEPVRSIVVEMVGVGARVVLRLLVVHSLAFSTQGVSSRGYFLLRRQVVEFPVRV